MWTLSATLEQNWSRDWVRLNGSPVINATDTTYRTGKLGLNVYAASATLQNVHLHRRPNSWTGTAGTWTDLGLASKRGQSTGDGLLMSGQTATNGLFLASVSISGSTGGGAAAALVFRANTTGTQGYVANIDALNDVVTLFRFNGDGSATTIARHVTSIDVNRTYTLAVHTRDDRLTVLLDRAVVIEASDRTYTSGHLGLNTWNSQATFTDITHRPHANRVTNPGFEYGDLRGWTEWHPAGQAPAYGVDGYDVHAGERKLYFHATNPYQQSAHQLTTDLPDGAYTVGAWVKLNQPATIARLELAAYGGTTIDVHITPTSTYQFISAQVTITTGQLDIGFYVNGPAHTSLQIDDVTLQKV